MPTPLLIDEMTDGEIIAEHADIVDAVKRGEYTDPQVVRILDVWTPILPHVEATAAALTVELARLERIHDERRHAVAMQEPALVRALNSTLEKGQFAPNIDPDWRRQYPSASVVHGEHERLSKEADEAQRERDAVRDRLETLNGKVIPGWQRAIEAAEGALERSSARRAAEAAALERYQQQRSIRDRAADGARRLVGKS